MLTIDNSVTGLILAGGAGTRVGGKDKGLLTWEGKTLIASVAQRLRPQVDSLFISCNRNLQQYQAFADFVFTDNRRGYEGPLAGIEAAINHITSHYLLVVACDTPKLPPDLRSRLLSQIATDDNAFPQITYAHDGERGQYLCSMINVNCLTTLPDYLGKGGRTVRHWLKENSSVAVDFSDCPESFKNFNRLSGQT